MSTPTLEITELDDAMLEMQIPCGVMHYLGAYCTCRVIRGGCTNEAKYRIASTCPNGHKEWSFICDCCLVAAQTNQLKCGVCTYDVVIKDWKHI